MDDHEVELQDKALATTCDGRILGVKMTYADEAMTGVTPSSGLARLKVSRPRR